MKKFILVLMLVVGLASLANAAVVLYEKGTKLGTVEKVNLVGGSITGTVSHNTGTITATATPTITGGTIDGATIGATSPSTGKFTTIEATTSADFGGAAMNWTDVTLLDTGVNWQSTGILTTDNVQTAGINWTSVLGADTGINWADLTGL